MQITTGLDQVKESDNCCLYHKDTKLNANHNILKRMVSDHLTVAYITKILN